MRAPNLSVAVALLAIAVVTGPRLVIYMVGGRERDTVRLAVTRPVLHLHLGRFFDPFLFFFSEQYSQHRLCNPRYPE
ncbi:hypothetical protein COCC4DRAFT_62598 [Bipolaris maydis ATCC 48331]|uniref:Uncharacterized protein n=2 Tax=Cochliobolus heterostrophus TaxID=5016 RepID=M2UIK8_COCH5|nr:uncharacterized protein COCC4DRAFT_62598 [Bipolaris maydis ATCC 48331]EMD87823.1 hypothetical protein COCHEDRAFT_1159033 [Bipolaris maydis C5]KAJ5020393.1 hypothetical protein J3E73DRAFT_201643 [Bipolaris maydis]ENI03337.1 hypothetical protein COCC4DRAFT_62598 [Bipolaris maydis ATCC 48331]KAJ5020445.1 hypothetical protein J3E73DRAFT_411955 [Bipolaris maydis]KAJ6206817.1 hypothetical protein PSV09DRAFT_1159033 [Bipolaris maydis]